eukprot:TRINITY_DN294_c0_g1_i7.p3 TRINITY_DN294_c0_g1~~TRINITY_DN294_c0_g1_i7.p3  ORF type:complete len:110 (+),score=9.47 TRINITY_DN294_c0_g1_i7:30-359(+)
MQELFASTNTGSYCNNSTKCFHSGRRCPSLAGWLHRTQRIPELLWHLQATVAQPPGARGQRAPPSLLREPPQRSREGERVQCAQPRAPGPAYPRPPAPAAPSPCAVVVI